MKKVFFIAGCCTVFFCIHACKPKPPVNDVVNDDQVEAREDSLELVAAYALQDKIKPFVTPDMETRPIRTNDAGDDAADDMAVWINKSDPEKSVILGSNKKGGIVAYSLTGEEIAYDETGRINNIDVMHDLKVGVETWDIAGCTNRSDQSIDLYRILPDTFMLVDVAAGALPVDTNKLKDVYGFCFYKGDRPYLFVNGKNGMVHQYEIVPLPDGKLDIKLVREIPFDSQTEGMVVDEFYHIVYVGEEDKGIWKVSARSDGGQEKTHIPMSNEDNPNIAYDIEGLAIYRQGKEGYLLASSQGNFSYAVFRRGLTNEYVGSFKISGSDDIDRVDETDGIEAVAVPLGAKYPQGVFIVQDGFNHDGDSLMTQNFKLVNWSKINAVLEGER